MVITRLLTLVSSAVLVGIASISLGDDERAMRYMARYLKGEYGVNVSAILKETSEDNPTARVKILRSKDGKFRRSVLSPLHLDVEFVDDGKQVKTYLPDDRVIFVQASTPISVEANFRLPLVQKNYTLKSETGKKIADRRCVTVTATSKYSQVPYVRYHFDEATGFPLGMETISPDGGVLSGFEIIEIKFPAKLDGDAFKLSPVAGVKTNLYVEQKGIPKVADAAPKVGFTPIVPATIPFGFQIQKISVSSEDSCRLLCLKMTDGIQRATIYEWTYVPGEHIKTGEASSYQIVRGIKVLMVCDLGSDLRESFLRPFVARLDQGAPTMLTSIGF